MKLDTCYVIAEMANAHEGNADAAKQIIAAAAAAGVDAIKFQIFTPDELATPTFQHYALYERLQMPKSAWFELAACAHELGLDVCADVFGMDSARLGEEVGIDCYKIHAADTSNHALLGFVAATGKPVLLSAGGSTWIELAEALHVLQQAGATQIAFMFGVQNYPTALSDSNLRRIETLRHRFNVPVGFAGHPAGDSPEAMQLPLWAMAAGADLLEIHLTLDRSRQGLDYYSSLESQELVEIVQQIRMAQAALGQRSLQLSPAETVYRSSHKKWLVAIRDLNAGDLLTAENVVLKRTPELPAGLPLGLEQAIGRRVIRPIAAHTPIQRKDLAMKVAATLACRAESVRLYGKPMQLVGDRPIIHHLIRQLRMVSALDEIVLAISEGPSQGVFVDFAQREGLPYVVGPEKDVLKRLIMAAEAVGADIALRTTTENPYIYWENIDELIRLHVENNADLTVTERLPLGAFVEIISVDALRKSHRHGEDRHRSELCTLFIAENPDLFTIQRVAAPLEIERPDIRLTVDTPQDLIVVRAIWDALQNDNELIRMADIVEFLDAHPEIRQINTGENTLYLWK
ncbi:MAG: N-acetylneuraminate synthase family protein [Caldilineaceae bacterium]|nr:N-acetylneuraminate synthase family protein [Caldilineaceae bacterium]